MKEAGMEDSTTLVGEKTKTEVAKEIELATRNDKNKEMEAALDAAINRKEKKENDEALGLGLPLDPEFFVKYGVIKKTDVPIVSGLVVDMQTLTQKHRMLAEMLVKTRFKTMAMDNVYSVAIEAAMLAVAITKANGVDYPIPEILGAKADDAVYIQQLADKAALFDTLLNAPNDIVNLLSLIYSRLENADALKGDLAAEDQTPKK